MSEVRINGNLYDIDLFVFDKDGLLFESRQFWRELARSRMEAAQHVCPSIPGDMIQGWMEMAGVSCQWENGRPEVLDVDPMGLFAVASVPEEITGAAVFFSEHLGLRWLKARETAEKIFLAGDEGFQLSKALKPREGFPWIFQKLRDAKIPYGIATSDTCERAKESIDLFDNYQYVEFTVTIEDVKRGKPSPDMLWLIQSKTGIPMEKIAMVGDSWVDVKMAEAAGAIGIGIPEREDMRQRMAGTASEIIRSLADIQFMEGG